MSDQSPRRLRNIVETFSLKQSMTTKIITNDRLVLSTQPETLKITRLSPLETLFPVHKKLRERERDRDRERERERERERRKIRETSRQNFVLEGINGEADWEKCRGI